MTIKSKENFWWKHAVFYHIYPQSFYDTNRDGIGDIQGIIQKFDHLSELGVDAIWLSPIYKSPMVDSGYDIADYLAVDPRYGDLFDLKALIDLAHKKDIKVIMDLVLNHTSDQHPWFIESRASKDNPKRDWYLWNTPQKGKYPNNWRTNFGKSAWQFDSRTEEYYYHSFFKEQPDLNWRNPELKNEMFKIIRRWLNMGIDGFRLDVINLIIKERNFKNNPMWGLLPTKEVYNRNQPETYEILKDFRALLDEYGDKMSVGEVYAPPPGNPRLVSSFLGNGKDMLHLAFDFSLFFRQWNAHEYCKTIKRYYKNIPKDGWACFVFSNHDLGRSIKRFGFTLFKYQKAKILATLLLTLKGTPFIYYGDEIGMENTHIPRKKIKDIYGKMLWPFYKGRDNARTPLQWNASKHAGFSENEPWLPVNVNYETINIEHEKNDHNSLLNVYKELIQIRKKYEILQKGDWKIVDTGKKNILSYARYIDSQEIRIILNFSFLKKRIPISPPSQIIFSTHRPKMTLKCSDVNLEPFEALILLP